MVLAVLLVREEQLGGEVHIGFVEWDDGDGEKLVDLGEEDARFLVEFYMFA